MHFNEQQVTMLREGNVVPPGSDNALETTLKVTPTPLDAGLRKLADLQPEQLPHEGVGALKRKRYWADIERSGYGPAALFELFRRSFNEVTPVFVDTATEPCSNDLIDEGETITLSLPMRGHVQVRVAELHPCQATLLTIEGHPLCGAVRFRSEPRGAAVRFQVEVYERAASVLDLIAMRALGDRLQSHTWSKVVERMVELSGGVAREGVRHDSTTLDENEAKAIGTWLEKVAIRRKRVENAEKIAAAR
jgi:NADH dehydrogenase